MFGPVYADGSCYYSKYPDIAHAAGSAAQYGEDGNMVAALSFTIPHYYPYSAASAEQFAAVEAPHQSF